MRTNPTIRLAVAALSLALSVRASAQATRTWVSGVGDDANPCSRTAPCQTFAGAIAKTAAGGEIDALDPGGGLDPGGYGPVTITKSITIEGGRWLAGVDVGGAVAVAVVVNAGASDVVVLRNLRLSGHGGAPAGVEFQAGGALHVERSTITGFATGIDFRPAAGGTLVASSVVIDAPGDVGVAVGSGAAATPARATLARVTVKTGGNTGVLASDNSFVTLDRCALSGKAQAGIAAMPSAAGNADVNVQDTMLSADAVGIRAQAGTAGQATVRLSRVVVLDRTPAAEVGVNGQILSFGDNRFLDPENDFTVAADPDTVSVTQGAAATLAISRTATAVSPGPLTLSCAGLPAGARCSFSPETLPVLGPTASSTLTITTDGSPAAATLAAAGPGGGRWALLLFGLGAFLAGSRARRVSWRPLAAAAAALALGVVVSCGGGGGGTTPVAPGTYPIQVVATSALTSHQIGVTLTVVAH
jgi:hypothetical protein